MKALFRFLVACAIAVALTACGGGGSGSASSGSGSIVLTGTAATGAPMVGALITVFDKTSAIVGTTTVAADGGYTLTLTVGAQAPFVLTASRDDQVLYSSIADGQSATVNITPLTTLVAARLSPSGDPAQLLNEIKSGAVTVNTALVQAKVTEIINALAPAITAAGGSTATNFLTGRFAADGTGMDRVLDIVKIDRQNISGSVTMVVTVNNSSATDSTASAPITIQFNSSTSVPTITATISPGTLLPLGGSTFIADLLTRMNTCYALTTASRVSGSAVLANECKSLFVGNDPTQYLHNGSTVSSSGAFASLFKDAGTGTISDRANFEYFRSTGDWVFTFRMTDLTGNVNNTVGVARLNGTDNKLYLIGNQYTYNASVKPIAQSRDFVNQSQFNYYVTGYNINIQNVTSGGTPIFGKVIVTTPRGNTLTFKPKSGLSYLGLTDATTTYSTSIVRLAAKFIGTNTLGYVNPAQLGNPESTPYAGFGKGFNGQLADDEIAAIPDQGVWTLDFYNPSGTLMASQRYKTFSRARTMSEMAQIVYAIMTATARTELSTYTSAKQGAPFTTVTAAVSSYVDPCDANIICLDSSAGDFWTVPTGAVAPNSINTYGSSPAPSTSYFAWDDSVNVASTARKTSIKCSPQTLGDVHCDSTNTDQYANGTTVRAVQMFATNIRQLQISRMLLLYTMPAAPI